MALTDYIRYWWLTIKHPRAWRFIDEGFGIAARHRRSKRYWTPHLELTKSFIVAALEQLSPASVTVLGSGGLLDFPEISKLPASIEELRLIDGNPAHKSRYEELRIVCAGRNIALNWRFEDILSLPDEELADEVVISLNLVSQLALMSVGNPNPAALHLAQLGQIAARAAILIGDQSWLSYLPDRSNWQEEAACPDISRWEIPGMTVRKHDQWFWHVAPYGIEHSDCGLIHDVHARLFVREE